VLKPSRPRYDFIWDPSPVVSKLAALFPHESLSLEMLTRKLVLLLALASGQRCQTLAAIRVSQVAFTAEKVLIRVPDRMKTSTPGRSQPFMSFPRFKERDDLCIFALLSHYLVRTQDIRPPSCDFLFIALKRPHTAVGAQTISRWIRIGLTECGVSDIFSAHSTRHASTSAAARKGVPVDLIKRAAGWSGELRVFAEFYNRQILDENAFVKAVLSAE